MLSRSGSLLSVICKSFCHSGRRTKCSIVNHTCRTNHRNTKYVSNIRCARSVGSFAMGKKSNKQANRQANARKRNRDNQADRPAAEISVHLLGNGGYGTPKSAMVVFDSYGYLFNCGEGTQRIIRGETKFQFSRCSNIFITSSSWHNIGGLQGYYLSLSVDNNVQMNIHGPPGAEVTISAGRYFGETKFNMRKFEYKSKSVSDRFATVHYIPIFACESKKRHLDDTPDGGTESKKNRTESPGISDAPETAEAEEAVSYAAAGDDISSEDAAAETKPTPQRSVISNYIDAASPIKPVQLSEALDEASHEEKTMAVAYVIKPNAKLRNVDLNRCVERGISKGPHVGQLKEGKHVTLENGTVVHPEDVLCLAEPNRPVIVVDCPTTSYLPHLLSTEDFNAYIEGAEADSVPELIIHFTPKDVMSSPEYQKWMDRFSGDVKHVLLDNTKPNIANAKIYNHQAVRNHIHPALFPLLPYQKEPILPPKLEGNIQQGYSHLSYFLRGFKEKNGCFDSQDCIVIDNEKLYGEKTNGEECQEALKGSAALLAEFRESSKNETIIYPEIIFTGTGSSNPTPDRNVSGIWINMSPDSSILLDCGEGTYGQLNRLFGDQLKEMLGRLKAVFISHLHADHHLGVPHLLFERQNLLKNPKPLTIVAPKLVQRWYQAFDSVCPLRHMIKLVHMESVNNRIDGVCEELQEALNLNKVVSIWMRHHMFPFGLIIRHNDGWSLAYSGDSMPSGHFAQAGLGVDILIHEATFADGLEQMAYKKKHSTYSQAIGVGDEMQAKFTLLTHFSQRYAKIPHIVGDLPDNVGIAFDCMRVHRGNLRGTSQILPILETVYSDELREMGLRTKSTWERLGLEQNV